MTAPTPINLYGTAGSTLVVDLTLFRTNAQGAQVPVDLTGAEIWMTVKRSYADADPGFAQVTTTGGGIVINTPPTGGSATATFDDTVFAPVPLGASFVYDVKVKESSGVESTPIKGTLTIDPTATRAS